MEFGIFNSLYIPQRLVDENGAAAEYKRLRDEVDWVVAADKAGFKYTWATEHHFLTEYSHMSANESFLGYVAALTENIHIASGIMNATPPVNHPARIAERAAILDLLSTGRFELGLGRGSSTTEQRGFGIEDPEITREMFDETVPEIVKMWRDEPYPGFEGRFFSMPERNVLPKPYSKPHPPLWVAAGSPSTFQKAGEMGLGVLCFSMAPPKVLAPAIEAYKEAIANCKNPVGEYVNDNVMMTTQLLCLEDGDRARKIGTDITAGYHDSLVFKYLDTFPRPDGIPVWPDLIPEPTEEGLRKATEKGMALIGDPEECAKAIEQYQAIGADQLTFGMLSTTMSIEVAIETIETFGKHVLPNFDTDPVHRSTKFREAAGARG
jgi:alkanesulfonate monooxygenase SsuD/methylene tetrahydromethanopterin reductase-like flavin-dependent oxidoreductase (luciferase family)